MRLQVAAVAVAVVTTMISPIKAINPNLPGLKFIKAAHAPEWA